MLSTWLSVEVARGSPVSEVARAYLDRMERRVTSLHCIGDEMAQAHGLRALKGSRIAAHLPRGLLRHSGDVDLVAPDERALWTCVRDLQTRYAAEPRCVSLLEDADGTHVGVAMKWPAEEPHLDKPMGADITTCAFAGDLKGVPIRVQAPTSDDLAGLFAVAEERFQRKFRVRDMLDLLVLADTLEARLGDGLTEAVCSHADELALAPELLELVTKTDGRVPVSAAWRRTADELRPLARAEKTRRRPDRPGVPRLRFGLPLDTMQARELAVVLHRRAGGDLAATPVGTCLLADRPVLTEEAVVRARVDARAVAARQGGR